MCFSRRHTQARSGARTTRSQALAAGILRFEWTLGEEDVAKPLTEGFISRTLSVYSSTCPIPRSTCLSQPFTQWLLLLLESLLDSNSVPACCCAVVAFGVNLRNASSIYNLGCGSEV